MVAIDTKRKSVQHQVGGIVKEVLVGEGSMVKAGQVVIRLDEATARANYQSVRQRYLSMRATQDRLRQAGADLANTAAGGAFRQAGPHQLPSRSEGGRKRSIDQRPDADPGAIA